MRQDRTPRFELPAKLEQVLASLSGYYGRNNKPLLQKLIVNSAYHVHEEWTYDNLDGGTYGHAIYFQIPEPIFYEVFDNLGEVAQELREGINRLSNTQNEYIHEVFLELQESQILENWREQSGVLIQPNIAIVAPMADQLNRLWKPGYFRLFISHVSANKVQASELKNELQLYGVSSFVAHNDIEPTREWQDEIENALYSMDALLALLTKDFHDSNWTDQEIGVAIGRQVPIAHIRLGRDPYGFIGKYQALSGINKDAGPLANDIYELLWANPRLNERLVESLVTRFEDSDSYAHANSLMGYVEKIEKARPGVIDRLEDAPQRNSQVARAWHVKGRLPAVLERLRKGQSDIS